MDGRDLSYREVQRLSYRVARGLARSGIAPGEKVAILSGNDPVAFACVFGISRAGSVWCPINPRNEGAENKFILDQFDCTTVIHAGQCPARPCAMVSSILWRDPSPRSQVVSVKSGAPMAESPLASEP